MRLISHSRHTIFLVMAVMVVSPAALAQIIPLAQVAPQKAEPKENSTALVSLNLPTAAMYLDVNDGYTIEKLTELALTHSSAIEAIRQDIARAEGELRQAGYRPNPTFDFERTRNPVSAPENSYVFGVTLPVELGGKRRRRVEVARIELEIAQKRLADAERTLRFEVKNAYGELITAIANLRFREEISDIDQEFFRVVQSRFDEGDASGLDRNLLVVELNRLATERLVAHQKVTDALVQIRQLVRLDQDEPLKVRGMLDTIPVNVTREGMLLAASIERPDLQAARLLEEKSEATVRLQKSMAIPNLNTVFRYTLDNAYFDDIYGFTASGRLTNVRDNDKSLTLGFSMELPLFNRNKGNISAAGAQVAQAHAHRESLEQIIKRDVQTAVSRYESATRNLSVLTQYVLPGAQLNLQTIRGAYEAGQLRLLDVLTEQRKLIEVQTAIRTVQLAVFQAQNDLERAVGKPIR